MSDGVFGDQPVVIENDTLTALVGENAKYKSVEDLAKAYVNADSHIDELRRDLAQLRAEKALEANNVSNQPPVVKEEPKKEDIPQAQTPKPNGEEDWRSRIREELRIVSEEEKYSQNVTATSDRLVEVYGNFEKAQEAVRTRANELGVSVEWLRDAAARSPNAFYASMGIQAVKSTDNRTTPASVGDVRKTISTNGERNYRYYEDVRKSNKSQYYSVDVQKEMQAQAKKLGDAFYA